MAFIVQECEQNRNEKEAVKFRNVFTKFDRLLDSSHPFYEKDYSTISTVELALRPRISCEPLRARSPR